MKMPDIIKPSLLTNLNTILVVDDDRDVLWTTSRLLSDAGYTVLEGHTGAEALALTIKHRPSILLLDVMLPDRNGIEVARQIKLNSDLAGVFVILASGACIDPQDQAEGLKEGLADGYVTRPFSRVDFLARIEAFLRIRAAQEALRKRERQFRLMAETIEDVFWLATPLFNEVLYASPAFERIWGRTCAELYGQPGLWLDSIHPEDLPQFRADLATMAEGACLEMEYRIEHSDGTPRWISGRGYPVGDGSGNVTGIVSDVTSRKQAEQYRELAREVLQILNEPADLQSSIRQVLSLMKQRTGFDAVGVRLQEGVDFPYFAQEGFPEEFLLTENSLLEAGADGEPCRDEDGKLCLIGTCGLVLSGKTDPADPHCTPGGSFWTNHSSRLLGIPGCEEARYHPRNRCVHEGYASIALVPIRTRDKIVGLVQFNDRHPKRFSREAVEMLEGMVAHIGVALMRKRAEEEQQKLEGQLMQAQKLESVGQLAGGVAHDFNNMLCVILGHVNLALMDLEPSQPLHVNMEEIRKAAEHSADLTRQLLAFARKQTVAPQVLDLNRTVTGIWKLLQRLIGEGIELNWQPGGELWQVKVDPSQVDQILTNLCVNARDSIADVGSIVIETDNISIGEDLCPQHPDFVPGEYVRLVVSDNGCGMDKAMQARIFEPFYTTKGVGKGTGLGLSTVYGAVKQNNGFVHVYSELGLGTTFTIYLPRYQGGEEQQRAKVVPAPAPRGQETILLVEDEPAILAMTTLLLTRQGYSVLQANTPGNAVYLATEHPGEIQLLITDVVLPEMNGLELAEILGALHPGMRRLFMSGYPAGIIARHGLINDGLNFIHKPFSLPDLAAKVREVLDGK
jgi:PAS domain S-box-containing protein